MRGVRTNWVGAARLRTGASPQATLGEQRAGRRRVLLADGGCGFRRVIALRLLPVGPLDPQSAGLRAPGPFPRAIQLG